MKPMILFWMAAALAATTAHAWLGETKDQCDRRYGNPDHVDEPRFVPSGELRTYRTADWVFAIEWLGTNNTASVLTVLHQPWGSPPQELSYDEKQVLLKANAQGQKWAEISQTIDGETWARTDKLAIAQYSANAKTFFFYLTAAAEARAAYLKIHKPKQH